ncbi:hypothetical protein [Rhodohalobacter sp. 614A]|uniref:hypothetical protein n=1 Tax=Rhodohalobacter sp. 614A TaxID=2908649 RepID=UPI001F39A656|nr:hypothetical protein [Rhodohalobacter sp. 614A]
MRNARTATLIIVLFIITGNLLSCNESNIATDNSTEQLATANVNASAAKQAQKDSPQEVFAEFEEMVKEVEKMTIEEIDNLSDEEILEIGEPILKATEGTVTHSKETLEKLVEPLYAISDNVRTLTRKEHAALSKEVERILASDRGRKTRDLSAEDIRELLIKFNGGGTTMMLSSCETTFDVTPSGQVLLYTGDNFNMANGICPTGSVFYVQAGTHTGQSVNNSKTGNAWVGVGVGGPTMDGQGSLNRAFNDGMNGNSISWIEITDYDEYGIFSDSGTEELLISNMTFIEIGDGKNGEFYSAIRIDDAEDLIVQGSYFEDVSSSILFDNSIGPLKVLDNEALNPGRNFFQCTDCSGEEIRINGNSIEHNSQYGSEKLEDFISIYESFGEDDDYIQVNNNRARTDGTGSGVSDTGSFIILGDDGGEYQEAEDNIGVNPGNAGIGAAGGEYISVSDNKMFSDPIEDISNVAFYSYRVLGSDPCSNHEFDGNVAHWYCYRGDCGGDPTPVLNKAHAPTSSGSSIYCGLTLSQIRHNSRVLEDTGMDEDIWDEW